MLLQLTLSRKSDIVSYPFGMGGRDDDAHGYHRDYPDRGYTESVVATQISSRGAEFYAGEASLVLFSTSGIFR